MKYNLIITVIVSLALVFTAKKHSDIYNDFRYLHEENEPFKMQIEAMNIEIKEYKTSSALLLREAQYWNFEELQDIAYRFFSYHKICSRNCKGYSTTRRTGRRTDSKNHVYL